MPVFKYGKTVCLPTLVVLPSLIQNYAFSRAKIGLIQMDEYQRLRFDFCLHIYEALVKQLVEFQNVIVFILSNH